jgi:hypothetical protein
MRAQLNNNNNKKASLFSLFFNYGGKFVLFDSKQKAMFNSKQKARLLTWGLNPISRDSGTFKGEKHEIADKKSERA